MTLRPRANSLSSWVESCCGVMVVFVVVVEVMKSAFVCVTENTYRKSSKRKKRKKRKFKLSEGKEKKVISFEEKEAKEAKEEKEPFKLKKKEETEEKRKKGKNKEKSKKVKMETRKKKEKGKKRRKKGKQRESQRRSKVESKGKEKGRKGRVCPWISLQIFDRRETCCTSCQSVSCEPFRLAIFATCQDSKELVNHNGCGCVSACDVGDLLGGASHH